MSNCLTALVFLIVCANSVHSQVRYYITPSLNDSCPQDLCLTLSDFATNSNSYYRNKTSLALCFMPGHHILDRDLSLSHADSFSMTNDVRENENETVFIECVNKSGRFEISNANFVSVNGMHFYGCGGNEVSQVVNFIVEDAIFQGVEADGKSSSSLVINEVNNASIQRSIFISNTPSSNISEQHPKLNSNKAKLDYVFLKRNPQLTVGGAMNVAFSNVSIVKSKFVQNTAEIGGALFAHNSSLHIASSTFTNNRANIGGVMVTCGSSVNIGNSSFNTNTAEMFGGVMVTYKDSLTVIGTTFINNSAGIESGVIEAYDSLFSIVCSSMSDNTAQESCGVICLVGGSFSIGGSNFTNNTAYYDGGVLRTHNECTVSITSAQFTNNTAGVGGVIYASGRSAFSITGCTFTSNSVTDGNGGVMATYEGESLFIITNSTFTKNNAIYGGGVMCFFDISSCSVTNSYFTHNSAADGGVLFTLFKSSFNISNSTFTMNSAYDSGGVIFTHLGESSLTIIDSVFSNNSGTDGGVLYTFEAYASFIIISSSFTNNHATDSGGVLLTSHSSFNITNSTFASNTASADGGVVKTFFGESFINIISCTFTNNSADIGGGVVGTLYSETSFNIIDSTFAHNSATRGGVMGIDDESSFRITRSLFTGNTAANYGGVIHCTQGSFDIRNSSFRINKAKIYGGIMFNKECSTHIANSMFQHNLGSLYTFNSKLSLSGQTRFENCGKPLFAKMAPDNHEAHTLQEGGAITSFKSTVNFTGVSNLSNNKASRGGAVLAIESTIVVYGRVTIANNTAANNNGGGVSLHQSELEIRGHCSISHNLATQGGGISATSSTIAVYQPGMLKFFNNRAENGSGIYLEVNAKLYILKNNIQYYRGDIQPLVFDSNRANYGGAVYVADGTNSGACSIDTECFMQTFALYGEGESERGKLSNVIFSGNTATKHGDVLFGGLLDRCVPSPFAEVSLTLHPVHSGVDYIVTISNIARNSISSPPIRLCFCNSDQEPECSYQPTPIKVKKGEPFNMSLVAVDQVNHTVVASIISSLSSHDGGFSEGQQTQHVGRNCTDLRFNVFSPHDAERISLYADGPCGSSEPSTRHLDVYFTDCICPIGFEPSSSELTRCICTCDSKLIPYITSCNSTTKSLLRMNTISWITYTNDTDPPGYVIHPNCPYDYCESPTRNVNINFNIPNGADSQCAHNRMGLLCGACQEHFSLSLGSSRCLQCESYWPAVFIVILLAAFIAGFLLVIVLLVLNMTVAVGLVNSFIFYANIVGANSTVFFPQSETSFPMIFVAWLNLDIGIDVCFIDGLDVYTKTWLQLFFPLYIISLVIIVIVVSHYSPRFTRLIGKRDPVATLATLILLSYNKLLSIIVAALSFAVLEYPDDSRETVWLPDSNVKYFQGKHIALTIVAVFIILIGVPYTALLLLWQWLVRLPDSKVFKWTSKTRLNAFVMAYHIPYNSIYRYWTGLLLFVRVILYITASVTASANPQTFLLVTIILIAGLLLFKGIVGSRVYKKSIIDIFETIIFFNLIALTAFSLYDFKTDVTKQTVVAYISTTITLILLIAAFIYHLTLLARKHKATEVKEYPLMSCQSPKAEVTHTFVEIPKLHNQCLPLETNGDEVGNNSAKRHN